MSRNINVSDLSDEDLLSEASKDKAAENELIRRYIGLVRKCCKTYCIPSAENDDLVQEGLIGLLSSIRSYNSDLGIPFSSYAKHCIKNQLNSALQAATRLKHIPLNSALSYDELSGDGYSEEPSFEDISVSPEKILLAKESLEELKGLISECLSDLERKVLVLYLFGLSYKEIAQHISVETKSVDNAIQRIRSKLSRNLNSGDFSIS